MVRRVLVKYDCCNLCWRGLAKRNRWSCCTRPISPILLAGQAGTCLFNNSCASIPCGHATPGGLPNKYSRAAVVRPCFAGWIPSVHPNCDACTWPHSRVAPCFSCFAPWPYATSPRPRPCGWPSRLPQPRQTARLIHLIHLIHLSHLIHPIHPSHPSHPIHPIHPSHPIHPCHPTHPSSNTA